MEDNYLLIQNVTLARCGKSVDSTLQIVDKKASQIQIVEFTVEKTITCVVDKERNIAIDIETCKVWNIPKRDENNRIIEKIDVGQLYPVVFTDKKWDEISYLYQLSLKSRAKKVYQRYLDDKKIDENNKVKTKEKEK